MLGDSIGVSAVLAAMLGLSILLLTGVLTWKDCLTYPAAWDTLFWFAILVGAPLLATCASLRRLGWAGRLDHLNWNWRRIEATSFACARAAVAVLMRQPQTHVSVWRLHARTFDLLVHRHRRIAPALLGSGETGTCTGAAGSNAGFDTLLV